MRQYYKNLQGFESFMRSLFDGKNTWADIARMVTEKYGSTMTKLQIKAYSKNHHIEYGRRDYVPPRTAFVAIPGFEEWFEAIQSGKTAAEVSELAKEMLGLDMTPSQVRTFRKNHRIQSGRQTRFQAGHVPYSKGKRQEEYMSAEGLERTRATRYKKGNRPHNWMPVGTIKEKSDGYLWIKIAEPSEWVQYQRWIWMQAGRVIPNGCLVTFLDGNKRNFDLDNLAVVTGGESAEMTTRHLRFGSGTIGQVGLDIARIHLAARREQ